MMLWLWVGIGAAVGYLASQGQRLATAHCVMAGMVLGPLAVGLFWLPSLGRGPADMACPYCSRPVAADARLCQHCRAILVTGW